MYVGENFSVKFQMQHYFALNKMLTDSRNGGLVRTKFENLKHVKQMSLSQSAEKIMNVPNAGGSSVISEVLSYEMLQRCFGAKLLKVSRPNRGLTYY